MPTLSENPFLAGQDVLVVDKHGRIYEGIVKKNLKSVFKVELSDGRIFKFHNRGWSFNDKPMKWECSEKGFVSRGMECYSVASREFVEDQLEKINQRKEEKRREQDEKAEKARMQKEDELNEAKERIGGPDGLMLATRMADIMPDESHYRVVDVPSKNDDGFRRMTIHIWNQESIFGYMETKMTYTYQDFNKPGSFCSCSEQTVSSVEEGIWEAVRSVYHSW